MGSKVKKQDDDDDDVDDDDDDDYDDDHDEGGSRAPLAPTSGRRCTAYPKTISVV